MKTTVSQVNRDVAGRDSLKPYLSSDGGQIRFVLPAGGVPEVLVSAYNAVAQGRLDEARGHLTPAALAVLDRMVAEGRPGGLFAWLLLAVTWQRLGQFDRALAQYERITRHERHPLVLNEMADLLVLTGQPRLAAQRRREALALAPDDPAIATNAALDAIHCGRLAEGLAELRRLIAADRITATGHSCYLFYSQYDPELRPEQAAADRRQWGLRHAPVDRVWPMRPVDRDPDRPLRVGFLSSDFRRHSVAATFESFLDHCPRNDLFLVGYGNVTCPDAVTERLAGKFDLYRSIHARPAAEVAGQIQSDRVDILVALAGHGAGHRLDVMALKPAPIQVDRGALATTGLAQIDYRLTDRWLDPPETQSHYVERLAFLEPTSLVYRPPQDAPAVSPLPMSTRGGVTFGSCNNALKIQEPVLRTWAAVLRACPGSRFLLKCKGAQDPDVAGRLLDGFDRHGVSPDRVRLVDWMADRHHLTIYHEIDIVLDCFPFSGAVTTLEALWMGVPVVTVAGDRFVARTGRAILQQVGLASLCADDPDQMVRKAVALAGRPDWLARLRASLREALGRSALCDATGYARTLAAALRALWHRWLAETEESLS